MLAATAILALIAVLSCDLVNRAVERRLLPSAQEPDPASWTKGNTARVVLALKTQDAERFACASDQKFDDYRCEYEATKRRASRSAGAPVDDNLRLVLQPMKTAVGGHSLLVGGAWNTPQLAFRRHQEPSRERRGAQLQPFYAQCTLSFLGRLDSVEARFDFGKAWSKLEDLAVAKADTCTILEAEEATTSLSENTH